MALNYYPMQDNYETTLARARDGAVGSVYVNATPTFTFPASSYTFITVDPGTTKEQVFICDSYNATAKTLNAYSVTVNKGPSLAYTSQTHNIGAKVIISDCYVNREAMKTAIDTAGTNPVATTTVRGGSVLATTAIAKAGTDTNGSGDPYVVQPSQVLDILNDERGSDLLANMIISTSRSASAETIAIKTLAGTDPSATDSVRIAFRSATAGTGSFAVVSITSALSLTIPSTATMGASNAVAFRLWLLCFSDSGTAKLAVVNTAITGQIFSLSDDQIASATLLDTGSDSAGVIYGSTAITTMPYRVLGYLDYTLATAGTRGTAPTKIQLFGPGIGLPGSIIQTKFTSTGASATGVARTPRDDTIPQITEGDEYLTLTVTPSDTKSKLAIETVSTFTNSSADNNTVALHQAAVADALAVSAGVTASNNMISVPVNYIGTAGVAVSTAYSIRIGSTTGTITLNGSGGSRKYGGVALSRMKITEFMV